jgi:hypothetical protein
MVGLFARARRRALRRRRRLRVSQAVTTTLSPRAPAEHQSAVRTRHTARNCAAACLEHRWTPAAAMSAGNTRLPCTPATLHQGACRQRSAARRAVSGLGRSVGAGSSAKRAAVAAAAHGPDVNRGGAFRGMRRCNSPAPRSARCRDRCRPAATVSAVSCALIWRHGETLRSAATPLRCGGLRGKPPCLGSSAAALMVLLPPVLHCPAEKRLAAR